MEKIYNINVKFNFNPLNFLFGNDLFSLLEILPKIISSLAHVSWAFFYE